MKELFIYRGLPGSGKTTRAKQFQKNIGGRLVGRDHLRDLLWGLDGYEPTAHKEDMITAHQEKMTREGLKDDQPVIVDDLNLRAKYVRRLMQIARQEGAEFSVIDLTNVPLDTCLSQNNNRQRVVPDGVITALHKQFIEGQPYPLPLPHLKIARSVSSIYSG